MGHYSSKLQTVYFNNIGLFILSYNYFYDNVDT